MKRSPPWLPVFEGAQPPSSLRPFLTWIRFAAIHAIGRCFPQMLQLPKSTNEVITMEGSFVKKLSPFLFLLCLLIATTGCHHKPVKTVVLIPAADSEMPSIKAQAGAGSWNSGWINGLQRIRPLRFSSRGRSAIQVTSWKEPTGNRWSGHITAQGGDYNVSIAILKTLGDTTSKHGHRVPRRGCSYMSGLVKTADTNRRRPG